ncbi:hypothetical protein M1B72_03205 [Geomonas paludis]|uniref:Uncharacterized protein n=1 Tax=Geomonas paludis TaxID=2740185 RepID=A0ABY4LHX9_9BACT|nr:hypothetical protein [Geomonas paludis]UPU36731.1 hypothetical protein M1B72_03205 [Geomonas paludis]
MRLVHNGKAGAPVDLIDSVGFSADGKRIAYSAMVGKKWRMFVDGVAMVDSEQTTAPCFSPDSRHIAFGIKTATGWSMVVDGHQVRSDKAFVGNPLFSADSQKIAYVEADSGGSHPRFVICDLSLKRLYAVEGSGTEFAANSDFSRIALTREQGGAQSLVEVDFLKAVPIREGARYDAVSNPTYAGTGNNLAYYGIRGGKNYLVLNGREEALPAGNLPWAPLLSSHDEVAAAFVDGSGGFSLHRAFQGGDDVAYEEVGDRAISNRGGLSAYAARRGGDWFMVVNGKEGAAFDKVVSPVFSPDDSFLVYRVRKNGKRFVVVSDRTGKVLKQHEPHEMVFPPVFTADGKSVAYGVKDGAQLVWKVEKL